MIKDMKELRYGQRTDKFKKSNRPDLEALSFSVMFSQANSTQRAAAAAVKPRNSRKWTTATHRSLQRSNG